MVIITDKQTHENVNLLFFLTFIVESVLDKLEGKFKQAAKYKFKKLLNLVMQFNKEIQSKLDKEAIDSYTDSTILIAELLNMSIDAYTALELEAFMEHCKNFKSIKNNKNELES